MIILNKIYTKFNVFLLLLFIVFTINISIEYSKYKELIYEEVYECKVEVINIYEKTNYNILKLEHKNFTFFTKLDKGTNITKRDLLSIAISTKGISFYEYLKGFFTYTLYFDILEKEINFRDSLIQIISSNHENKMIKELYNALFLAVPISKNLREVCANYGISHLIALSGFHLSVLSFLIYWISYFPYKFFQDRYFPYRNRKFDLLLVTMSILFIYLLLTNIVPSLLRAFVMFSLGVYLLRFRIKIISFVNLFLVLLIIMAIFPKYIFSLSLWFSISGVFYIFLYIKYFNTLKNMLVKLLLFNFWIYFAMNPIVHYFFTTTTYEQLYSPFITIVFTIFYPLELFAHLFGFAEFLDPYLELFLSKEFEVFEVSTSSLVFISYIFLSFTSIFNKHTFILLNIVMLIFNIYLFIFPIL
jgi:competence protein ComEC